MMNEELYIKDRLGDRNPFRVPEGYFDSLAAEVMEKLPEEPKQGLLVRLRPWMYAAACLVAVLFTATLYLMSPETPGQVATVTASAEAPAIDDSYVEDMADYVMADNNDIYAYLASEY